MNVKKVMVLTVLTIILSGCNTSNTKQEMVKNTETVSSEAFEVQEFIMGTTISQRVYGNEAERVTGKVSDRLKELEKSMTINTAGGVINQLNNHAGKKQVKLTKDAVYVIEKAIDYGALSHGAFDITIGPLVREWGIITEHPEVPKDEKIKDLLKLVDYKKIDLDKERGQVMLRDEGQVIDLGGIAKGFGGDEAIEIYKKEGIQSAFINMGGNVVTLGGKPDGKPWKIGIQDPRAESGKYVGVVNIKDKAVVTSGDYERYFEKDGKRYHHILDAKTGYPADAGLISTTIIADKSLDADALSTATFVLGLEEGLKLVESFEDTEGIFITKDKKIYTTSGIKDSFSFKDETGVYEYIQ